MIVYYRFFDYLRKHNVKQKDIIGIIGGGTLQKIRDNKVITTESINKICSFLNCRVEDILEYVPEEKTE